MNIQKTLGKAFQLFQANQFSQAIELLNKVLTEQPNNHEALANKAFIEIRMGEKESAKQNLIKAVSIKFDPKIINNLVILLMELQNWNEAEKYNDLLLDKYRDMPDILMNQALILRGQNQYDGALEVYDVILKKFPQLINAYISKGFTLNILKRYEDAIQAYQKGLKLDPGNIHLIYNLGITYNNNEQHSKAIEQLKKTVEKDKENIDAWLTLAAAQIASYDFDAGEKSIVVASKIRSMKYPNGSDEAIFQHAVVYMSKRKYEDALKMLDKLLKLNPSHIEGNYHKGLCMLFLGRYDQVCDYYAYRSIRDHSKNKKVYGRYKDFNLPKINKETKILIAQEQGLGDQLVLVRLIPEIKKQVKELVLSPSTKLIKIIQHSLKDIKVVDEHRLIKEEESTYKDYLKINFFSIFKYIDNVPEKLKEIMQFKADENLLEKFKKKYKQNNKKLIGLSWKSRVEMVGKYKSFELINLKDILREQKDNFNYINLQYGEVKEEIQKVNEEANIKINIDEEVDCFNDIYSMFALVSACDYVITASNFTAHIAGALGVKTFLLLPKSLGRFWYWAAEENSFSSWYPSVRIIEQEVDGEWESVFKKVNSYINNII